MKIISSIGINFLYRAIFGYDIFISYSRRDGVDYAYSIAQYFMKKGYECYIDQLSSISPGKELPATIKTAITKSTSFVLVGSESAKLSEPIENEIKLFLQHNKNKPLIPINIDGSVNDQSRWFKCIEGLPLLSESSVNLKNGTPTNKVLDRIENGLKFTKKSRRLRNITLGSLIFILLLIGSATFYSIEAFKKASGADERRVKAEKITIQQTKAKEIAEQNTKNAVKMADSVKEEIKLAKISLDSVKNKLSASIIQEQLLSQKNKVQEYIYQAQTERANYNINKVFTIGKRALEIEKGLKTNNAKYLLVDCLNSYSSKEVMNKKWPFDFNRYGSDLEHEVKNMKFFNMNSDKTQVILYTCEPKLEREMRLAVYPFDPPVTTWVRKEFDFGLLDLKKDSCIKIYNKYGYFLDYSSVTNNYYFITDDSLNSYMVGGDLIKFVLDDHLNVLYSEHINRPANQYLKNITSKADGLISDYTYVHSFDISNNNAKINLIHFGDTTALTEITIDSTYNVEPKIHLLDSFDLMLNQYSIKLASIKILNDKIYYSAGKSIFEKSIHNDSEQEIFKSTRMADLITSNGKIISNYLISPYLHTGFIMDTANFISIIVKKDSVWQYLGNFKYDYDIDSFELDEKNNYLILKNQFGFSYHKIGEIEKEINTEYTKKFGLKTTGKKFYYSEKINYHIDGNTIVDNNNADIRYSLGIKYPTHAKFTELTKTLVCLDSKNGALLVTDLSNMFLSHNISDDTQYADAKLLYLDDTASFEISNGNTKLIGNNGELKIIRNSKDVIPISGYISRAGFLNNQGLIYYYRSDMFEKKFNIFDVNTGYKKSIDLNLFLDVPLEFEITDKYIYFSESEFSNEIQNRKIVRFINPAISIYDFENILNESFFNLHN